MNSTLHLRLFPLAALAFALAACAPSAVERVNITQQPDSVTFYPRQAGIERSYLPQGAPLDAPRFSINELGATTRSGQILHATREYGKGVNRTIYRAYTNQGALKLREEYPSHTVTYDPPLREYPRHDALALGARWSGQTTATLRFPQRDLVEQVDVQYTYTVVDKRLVSVNNAQVEVFVITLEATDPTNPHTELNQELWFAPYLGLVRTPEGLYLVDTNLPLPRSQ